MPGRKAPNQSVPQKNTPAKKKVTHRKKNPLSRQTVNEHKDWARKSWNSDKNNHLGFPVVGIGASAGGLESFESFFKAMPDNSGMAFVLVAHLDPSHISLLPELLQKCTKMPVHQILDGTQVQPNQVYVIPPNKTLMIFNGVLQLLDLEQPRSRNLPIDKFFRSLAKDQGANAICVIFSGGGTDGTLGLKAIKGEAGMVMVQDEKSAKQDGMPRSAILTGLADFVLSPQNMPEQLIKYTKHSAQIDPPAIPLTEGKTADPLQKIYMILRMQTGHDFSLYKKNTICRRIERRMNIHQIANIDDYVNYLQNSECEAEILFKELLIGVTNFFRDADAFDALQSKYLPQLLKDKANDHTLRVWVPGCSTGEEAYSLAIILQESMLKINRHFNVQIFATDIDQDSIDYARAGRYPDSIMSDVSPEQLKQYFIKEDDGQYRIKKSVREMLVFATQNIIKDPPFTKLDILSCRNLLIYLGVELQKKLMPMFHYSLRQDGILFLGSSETIGQATDMFAVLDKKWKIFRRQPNSLALHPIMISQSPPASFAHAGSAVPEAIRQAEEISALQLVETILQQSNMAPCAVIDDACNIIYIHGRIGRFLEPPEGKVSVNILEMAPRELKSEITTAIRKVAQNKQEVIRSGLSIENSEGRLCLDLSVKPILNQGVMQGLMMVIFNETSEPKKKSRPIPRSRKKEYNRKSFEALEQELHNTRENLQTTIEELETSNEELKSTNEELQSTNEELQSTNEEMETSKEELQSLNEEASTVNAELQSRVDELSKINDDMKNLLDSTEIATLFLDLELRIRRFTPKTTDIIPLAITDIGRPIKHFTTSLVGVDLGEYGEKVLEHLTISETAVTSRNGHSYILKVRPYRTVNNVMDGVVLTFEDNTKRATEDGILQSNEARYRALVDPEFAWIWEMNAQYVYTYVSPQVKDFLGYEPEEILGKKLSFLMPPEKEKLIVNIFNEVSKTKQSIVTPEFVCIHKDGSRKVFETSCVPFFDHTGVAGYRGAVRDIPALKHTQSRE